MASLNKIWRFFATALCFIGSGLACIVLALIIFPFIRISYRDPIVRTKIARRMIYYAFSTLVWSMKFFGLITVETVNLNKVSDRDDILLVANHPTFIDVVLLISYFPNMNCVVKNALWSNLFLAGVVRCTGYISNRQPEQIIDDCVTWVKQGGSLIIFPEGSRTRVNQPMQLLRGAGNIAARAGKNLTPAIITCKPLFLNKESAWYKIPDTPPHIKIVFHDDIEIQPIVANTESHALASRRITTFLKNFFEQEVLANE